MKISAWSADLTDEQMTDARSSSISGFYFAWRSLQQRPDRSLAAKSGNISAETVADEIVNAQTSLMDIAAKMPALTLEDLAFKMAMWRLDAACSPDEMDRTERMAHAVFLDLIDITGMTSLLPPEDAALSSLAAEIPDGGDARLTA